MKQRSDGRGRQTATLQVPPAAATSLSFRLLGQYWLYFSEFCEDSAVLAEVLRLDPVAIVGERARALLAVVRHVLCVDVLFPGVGLYVSNIFMF